MLQSIKLIIKKDSKFSEQKNVNYQELESL